MFQTTSWIEIVEKSIVAEQQIQSRPLTTRPYILKVGKMLRVLMF